MIKYTKWLVAVMLILAPAGLQAAFEFESLLKADVEGTILDVAADPDAALIFLLTAKAVLIYSTEDQSVLDRIPLDERFDRIAYQPDDRLVLAAANPARVSIVQFNRIYAIDLTGRAVKGPRDAGVTLVVFDDYQ